jgi:hypothetical protein
MDCPGTGQDLEDHFTEPKHLELPDEDFPDAAEMPVRGPTVIFLHWVKGRGIDMQAGLTDRYQRNCLGH